MNCVLIVTALPIEYKATKEYNQLRQKKDIYRKGKRYLSSKINLNNKNWDIFILQTTVPGNVITAIETYAALEIFKPNVAIFVGIAGGFKDKRVEIGDVVVATKIYWYESRKERDKKESGNRSVTVDSTKHITQVASHIEKKDLTLEYQQDSFSIHAKPIASGEKVQSNSNSETCQFIRRNFEDSVAVEMEGYGFLEAAKKYSEANHQIEYCVIRGISDLIDDKDLIDQEEIEE